MGSNLKHLQSHVPGVSHHIQSNQGSGSQMPQAHDAKGVPHLPHGEARQAGNRAEGPRANIAPSQYMDQGCGLSS